MYEDEIIDHQTTKKIWKENDKLYLWLDNLESSAVDLGIMQLSISSITIPLGCNLKGANPPPPRDNHSVQNPPLGTIQGVKSPTPGT